MLSGRRTGDRDVSAECVCAFVRACCAKRCEKQFARHHHGKVGAKLLLPYHRELNILRSSHVVIKERILLPVACEGSLKFPLSQITFSLVHVPSNLAAELHFKQRPNVAKSTLGQDRVRRSRKSLTVWTWRYAGTDKSYVTLSSE
jgi:hypothetical protein